MCEMRKSEPITSHQCKTLWYLMQIMTATVETVSEQLDLGSILPSDRAIARSITLSDADVGSANVSVTKASVMGENGANGSTAGGGENGSGSEDEEEEEDSDDFWHTSVGKFKFTLDTLPQPLQYIHQLLTVRMRNILDINL